jgi:hypothetical protein
MEAVAVVGRVVAAMVPFGRYDGAVVTTVGVLCQLRQ